MSATNEPRLNLNTPRLQLPASLVVDQAPVVVGKSSHPPQPAHTAWYTVPFLSKREVPPSTCSFENGPPK